MKLCSFPGCKNRFDSHELCASHNGQIKRGKPLTPIGTSRRRKPPVCSFPACGLATVARGLCRGHYAQKHTGRPLASLQKRVANDAERYWGKVIKGDGCWGWRGWTSPWGYGGFSTKERKHIGAHRFSWELHNGPVPNGLFVLHKCDNPPCTRPDHLFLGTTADNTADMMAKGRCGRHGRRNGAQHYRAKLTDEQVKEILAKHRAGAKRADLARDFGMSWSMVALICAGKAWRHVAR